MPPPLQKPPPDNSQKLKLPGAEAWKDFTGTDLVAAIVNRRFRREPTGDKVSLAELAFLLWSTQGVKSQESADHAFRVVPSAGGQVSSSGVNS